MRKIFYKPPSKEEPDKGYLSDHNPEFVIIENTPRAKELIGTIFNYNEEDHTTVITEKEIQALREGKCLAININNEYVQYLVLK